MVTPEDMAANAEFIRMADQHVDVPGGFALWKFWRQNSAWDWVHFPFFFSSEIGGTNNFNYANVDLIIDTASKFAADVSSFRLFYASCGVLLTLYCLFSLRQSGRVGDMPRSTPSYRRG